MTPGEIAIILVLIGVVGLIIRSLWISHKTGRHCNGDCTSCGGCHGSCRTKQ